MNKTENAIASNHNTRYILIGTALLVLTLLTVWVSFITITVGISVFVALLIAMLKGSLVASFFMHLITELFVHLHNTNRKRIRLIFQRIIFFHRF